MGMREKEAMNAKKHVEQATHIMPRTRVCSPDRKRSKTSAHCYVENS